MPRPKSISPSYLYHKTTGQARVRLKIDGRFRDVYLGVYGSPESYEKFHRVLAEHFGTAQDGAVRGQASGSSPANGEWTVAMLAVKYDDFASTHYVKDGRPTDQRYRAAIEPLVQLFGDTLASDFGPKRFQALREHIIRRGNLRTAQLDEHGNFTRPGGPLSRDYVNNLMKSVARMFKWAVAEEKVPPSVPDALAKVVGLRKGRDARLREPEPVRPVPLEHFWPVVEAAPPQIAAMLQIQRLTGMRPDEVTIMRPCDLDRTGIVWTYRPESHKLDWLDQDKEVLIGPQAQAVLTTWLENVDANAYLFSPRATAEWNARQLERRRRKTSSRRVPLSRKRAPREHYDDRGYRHAASAPHQGRADGQESEKSRAATLATYASTCPSAPTSRSASRNSIGRYASLACTCWSPGILTRNGLCGWRDSTTPMTYVRKKNGAAKTTRIAPEKRAEASRAAMT